MCEIKRKKKRREGGKEGREKKKMGQITYLVLIDLASKIGKRFLVIGLHLKNIN